MISDYLIVAWILAIFGVLTKYWYACAILTGLMWLVFAVRIGKVHILQVEDLMPEREGENE